MLEKGNNLAELTLDELKEVDGGFIIFAAVSIGFQAGFYVGNTAMNGVLWGVKGVIDGINF